MALQALKVPLFFFVHHFIDRDLERKSVKYLGQAGIHEAMKGHAVYTKKLVFFLLFLRLDHQSLVIID